MQVSLNQQLWIAIHLLYANSSQALDIYQEFVARYRKEIETNKKNSVFKKLATLHKKIETVQTAGPFNIFEEHKSTYWLDIYNRSTKNHLIVLIGVLIFDLKIDEIEQTLRISKQKIRFFLNQVFKNTTTLQPIITQDLNKSFRYRKINDQKVSDFFVRENVVEYTLNLLDPKQTKMIEEGFKNYPDYKSISNLYKKIVEDIQKTMNYQMSAEDIRVNYMATHTKNINESYIQRFQGKKKLKNKTLVGGSTLAIICFAVIFLRPKWIKNIVENNTGQQILLQEVKPQLTSIENNLDESRNKVSLNELEVNNTASSHLTTNKINDSKTTVETEMPVNPKLESKKDTNIVATKENKAVKKGGLYRGTVEVTDLDQVSEHFTDKIVNLGGKKAGEVQLGWRKNDQTSYYHFLISTTNVEDIKAFLGKFGQLNFKFEDHPRQVPDGMVRIIVELKKQ